MNNNLDVYIRELEFLKRDLVILMEGWPQDSSFLQAKEHVELLSKLLPDQINFLKSDRDYIDQTELYDLRSKIENLIQLSDDRCVKEKFSEYYAMVDSLINYFLSRRGRS